MTYSDVEEDDTASSAALSDNATVKSWNEVRKTR